MAEWTAPLPDTAVEGESTHIEDHNAIVAAISEARVNVDAVDTAATAAQSTADDAAPAEHKHAAADVTSGTFPVARIPDLGISKVTGLQSALDGKQPTGDYATSAELADKADQSALEALEARVAALEAGTGA